MKHNIHVKNSKRDSARDNVLDAALEYAARGWAVLPLWWRKGESCSCGNLRCSNPGKHPIGKLAPHAFKSATTDPEVIRSWFTEYPRAGIAMATGAASGVLVLDVDVKNTKPSGATGWDSVAALEPELGPLPIDTMPMSRTPSGGRHLFFKHVPDVGSTVEKLGRKLDVKGEDGMIVLPPSAGYRWINEGEPVEVPERWVDDLKSLIRRPGKPAATFTTDLEKLAAALAVISNPDFDWEEWNRRAMAIWRASNGSKEGFKLFDEWSRKSGKYNADTTREKWDQLTRSPPLFIGAGSIFWWADQEDDTWRGEAKEAGRATKGQKQADVLISLAADADVFHSADDIGYADVTVNDHREVWPIRSIGFKRWIRCRYYEHTKGAPNSEALSTAINTIEARAYYEGETREVYLRVAAVGDDKVYLDLCDDAWRVVEIDRKGWRICSTCPVRFIRRRGMLALPVPKTGGSIKDLLPYLNVATAHEFILTVTYLLTALRRGPYPTLVLLGVAGAAKSSVLKVLRKLIDPNKAELRSPPRDTRDLFIAAGNSHMIIFDNLSYLPEWLSDAMCRLATGGGFATRELYSDDEEKLFDAMRPLGINGIDDVVVKGDLADRAIFLTLKEITGDKRRPEEEFWADFERDRPRILGALLDMVSHGLRALPTTKLDELPRMADFALWGTACCEGAAVWKEGAFMRAYSRNRAKATADIIDANMVAKMVIQFVEQQGGSWKGGTDDLLKALNAMVLESQRNAKQWPKAENALSNKLRRATPALRQAGVDIQETRHSVTKRRVWVLSQKMPAKDPYHPSILPKARQNGGFLGKGLLGGKDHGANGLKRPLPAKSLKHQAR